MLFLDEAAVHARIGIADCIPIMRDAMRALSAGKVHHLPRQIIPGGLGMFGIMAGSMAETFGAKLLSVFPPDGSKLLPSHQGVIVLFDPRSGSPTAIVDAGAVTALRTAAASAVATDVLARPDAHRLAILGYGEQARAHIKAIALVRDISRITIWGRDQDRAGHLAAQVTTGTGIACAAAATVQAAVDGADIVCTTTSADEPLLAVDDVAPGAHVNAVGSSRLGPSEIAEALVAKARFFGDSRASVLAQGAEFARARDAGLIGDDHFLAELGELLSGKAIGRRSADDVTMYKSLGHIVQDLATAAEVQRRAAVAVRRPAPPSGRSR